MKKAFAGIVSIIMVLSFGMTAFAADTVDEQYGSRQIYVQAKAVYILPENMYNKAVLDGNATINTDSGATVSVFAKGNALEGVALNVAETKDDDKEANLWISDSMGGLCDEFTSYDIYFTDKNGNRIDVSDEVTMSITTPDGYTNTQVYHISSDGTRNNVTSTQSGDNTVFIANEFGYYVLANQEKDSGSTDPSNSTNTSDPEQPSDTEEPSIPDNPTDRDVPQTGDTSNMICLFTLLFVTGGIIAAFVLTEKRKKNSEK